MNLFEAGIIAGAPAGATIGGVICKSHGMLAIVGGSIAGLAAGAVAGLLYAFAFIFLTSVVGVLWQAARKRADAVPSEIDYKLMTQVGIRGIFIGVLIALVCWFSFGWLQALVAALMIELIITVIAVARCELR